MKDKVILSRGEKILLSLYKVSGKTKKSIRYEDIVVAVFADFPHDFQLKGHPQYPDSGDLIHKPLYDYKKKGLIQAGNKMFALTEKGLVAVEKLSQALSGKEIKETTRLPRDIEKEVNRILRTQAFRLFIEGNTDLLDTDFYDYLGVTVRTTRNDFKGRLRTVSDAVDAVKTEKEPLYKKLTEYHRFMLGKFKDIVDYKSTA
jgi:hypothetical protein